MTQDRKRFATLWAEVRRRFTPTRNEALLAVWFLLSLLSGALVRHWRTHHAPPPPAARPTAFSSGTGG